MVTWMCLNVTLRVYCLSCNICLAAATIFLKWPVPSLLRTEKFMHFSSSSYGLLRVLLMSCSFIWSHTHNIWWKVLIVKLLIMQYSPPFYSTSPLGPNILLKVQWETKFNSRGGTSTVSIPTYPPETRNTRNPTASRKAAVAPTMVGQFGQSVTVTLSKCTPSFTASFIRPERAECLMFIQVWTARKTCNCTIVIRDDHYMAHAKWG